MSDKGLVHFVGAGGQARAVQESIPSIQIGGYFDDVKKETLPWLELNHLGNFNTIKNAVSHMSLHLSFGKLSESSARMKLFLLLRKNGHHFPTLIADDASLSGDVFIGEGSVIMRRSLINFQVHVGDNCIINNGVIVEHDVRIGSHTHLGPGVIISANAVIGADCYVGNGAVIGKGITIPDGTVVNPGTAIT